MSNYAIGDYVMHESAGVCQVAAIKELALQGKGTEKMYYELDPVFQHDSQVITPVDDKMHRLRDVKSADEMESILEDVSELDVIQEKNERVRQEKMKEQIDSCKSEAIDESTQVMDLLTKMPRFLSKFLVHILMWLDKHGWVPKDIIATDPYYSSAVLSNLGSIRMKSGYHHLTNWGTCSMIMLIGERKKRPFFDRMGGYEMRDSVELGITIDERLADGFYYAKTMKLLQKLIENPELLEGRLDEKVE